MEASNSPQRRWSPGSLALIFATWAILQLGGLFSPGLLDDVDSVYLQIAREMLQRHNFITPTIDGIRFFDKPPLMYWMAAASMRVFGVHDWAARLPLALGVLALLLTVYTLGIRLFPGSDRAGLYAALALATSLGTYLYTRFYIPDILIALWMTLSVHLFLLALDRVKQRRSPLWPNLGFATVMALDLLTKGLIGVIFPLAFVVLYLGFTHRLSLLPKFKLLPATAVFLLLAAPWHISIALRNPAIAMPAGMGLPSRAGWAWFYLYNEHIARFLGRRIPHDYGNVPVPLFWLLLLLWLLPWVTFLPAALWNAFRLLRSHRDAAVQFDSDPQFSPLEMLTQDPAGWTPLEAADRRRESVLACLLWAGIILGFFTLSSRQEYYHLPALPALALLVAGLLASADGSTALTCPDTLHLDGERWGRSRQVLRSSLYFLVPLGSLLFVLCGTLAFTAPTPRTGLTLDQALSTNPDLYNLSLGHVFDLTGQAMGFFRGPLIIVALGMAVLGPIAYFVRRHGHPYAANLTIATGMLAVLLAAHEGLARFYPILGSKSLALAIDAKLQPGDLIVIDGELTSGSTLLFYTPQRPERVLLVNGRVNGPWFGSFWPDAPQIFPTEADLDRLWAGPHRVFLLTYHPERRIPELGRFARVQPFATSGGKTVLSNRP